MTQVAAIPPLPCREWLAVRQTRLFRGLSVPELAQILKFAQARRLARGETVFQDGDEVRSVSLLMCGRVKLSQVGPAGDEVILRMIGAGGVVGGLCEATGDTHSSLAEALLPSAVLLWDLSVFNLIAARHPVLQSNRLAVLGSDLRQLQTCYRELATQKVSSRLARTLIRLAAQMGEPSDAGTLVALSQEELALMTGTTSFTVSRLLSRWEQAGVVSTRREAVLVVDLPTLLRLAQD